MNFEYSEARNLMVENQLRPNKINDKFILNLFNEIKKESQKVKEIIEEKIFDKSNNSKLKDNEKSESEFEIEWDDEN